jgi:PAS domain S-box-containing protein
VLLIFATAVPLIALIVVRDYHDTLEALQREADASSRIADQTARFVERFLIDTRRTMESMARRQSQLLDPAGCRSAAAAVVDINPVYANLAVRDSAGNLVCVAQPGPPPKPIDLDSFQRAIKENRFVLGAPVIAPVLVRWIVVARQPIRNANDEVIGVVSLPLDLLNLQFLVSGVKMPPGGLIVITAADGTVIARSLDPEKWVGTNMRNVGVVSTALQRKEGQTTGVGADGIERVSGFTTITEIGWNVASAIPTEVIRAPVRRALLYKIGIITVVLIGVTLLATAISRAIAAPVRQLSRTAQAVASGQSDMRAEAGGLAEIKEVSTAFNTMLDTIAQGERAIRENEARLRVAMVAGRIGMQIWNHAAQELYISPEWKRLVGYEDHEITNRTSAWLGLVHADDRTRVVTEMKDYFTDLQPGHEIEFRMNHRDGSERWMLVRVEPVLDAASQPQVSIACFVDITERTRSQMQIRDQLDELLRWQSVIVGREERVIELKREVNALLSAAGQSARYLGENSPALSTSAGSPENQAGI